MEEILSRNGKHLWPYNKHAAMADEWKGWPAAWEIRGELKALRCKRAGMSQNVTHSLVFGQIQRVTLSPEKNSYEQIRNLPTRWTTNLCKYSRSVITLWKGLNIFRRYIGVSLQLRSTMLWLSQELICTTEHLTLQTRCRINRSRYNPGSTVFPFKYSLLPNIHWRTIWTHTSLKETHAYRFA
jgi:hypothetical protein